MEPINWFFKKMPGPSFSLYVHEGTVAYGVGYLPATDDYRIFVVPPDGEKDEVTMFSSRAHAWKPLDLDVSHFQTMNPQGTLLKEALHWLDCDGDVILAFDLSQEDDHKYRKMLPPNLDDVECDKDCCLVGVSGGCLSLACYCFGADHCIDVWVMMEYNVRESWTKLFNHKLPYKLPYKVLPYPGVYLALLTEAQIFVHGRRGVVRILQEEEKWPCTYEVGRNWRHMIEHRESLIQIHD